ncbi:MAG: hypothetical protein E4H14_10045 [Candidatus Thorarchaeota archaeon]|nr:MAG: hypothetical protein E4H14_10045 [Candidatus Thorarchaeota archaeon]
MLKSRATEDLKGTRLDLLIAFSASTMLLVFLLILVTKSPAQYYEVSIYDSLGGFLWLLAIMTSAAGLFIMIRNAFYYRGRRWLYGFSVILLIDMTLLLMPVIRGYAAYGGGDTLTHIGWIKDLVGSGSIGDLDIYPAEHILSAELVHTSNISVFSLSNIIPALFSLFFIISFFLLAKEILKERSAVMVSLIFASILLFENVHLGFSPHPQSFLLIPFVLFTYLRSRTSGLHIRYALIVLVMIILMVIFHPLTILILVMIFSVHHFSTRRYRLIPDTHNGFRVRGASAVTVISLVAFFVWHSYAYLLVGNLKKVYDSLMGESTASELQAYSNLVGIAGTTPLELIALILNVYGQWLILATIAFFCAMHIFRNRNRGISTLQPFLSASFMYFAALSLAVFILAYVVGFGRILIVAILFSILLIPSVLATNVTGSRNTVFSNPRKVIALSLVTISLLSFSTLNLYQSPAMKTGNPQVTDSEFAGMVFLFDTRNENVMILEMGVSQYRFYDAICGKEAVKTNIAYGESTRPPDHFGYEDFCCFGESIPDLRFLVVSDFGRHFYEYLYPEYEDMWRFTKNDFNRLENDISIGHFYSNGNIDIYLAYSV